MMSNQRTNQDDLWVKCPAGAIQATVNSAMRDRGTTPAVNLQRRNMLAASATAAGVALLGGVAYLSTRPAAEHGPIQGAGGGMMATMDFGGINCTEVVKNIPAYIAGSLQDAEKVESMKEHIKLCDKCREAYEYNLQS